MTPLPDIEKEKANYMTIKINRFIVLSLLLFCASCFELFPVERRAVSKVEVGDSIYYTAFLIATGATTEKNIQIWRNDKALEEHIATYNKFDSASFAIHEKQYLVITLFIGDLKAKTDSIDIGNK